ncbi:MAG TPA: thioesterase family protein [Opitutaceae bacterium]|nr:acyl-CoA thioesterase [Opitutaceae bacterium]HRE08627.1 thioesterase family protein [Opitutaceae bacterium]
MARPTFVHTRRVEFYETDAAGIMHFSNFYRWMEVCEHEWFRSLGLAMMSTTPEGVRLGWPRRATACEFLRPLRCDDVVRITASVAAVGTTSVSYEFVFEKDRAGRWTEVARGTMSTVHVRQDSAGRMEAEPVPAAVRAALGGGAAS